MYWDLFRNFFHIGLFTIGGGYAMIPLIQQKVVEKKKWVSEAELVDLMAVAQSCPGIFAVNISIFIGYKLRGVKGFFRGIRPAVVALIAAPVFKMAQSARVTLGTLWIPVLSALLIWLVGVSPIYVILAAGLGGYAYGQLIREPGGGDGTPAGGKDR